MVNLRITSLIVLGLGLLSVVAVHLLSNFGTQNSPLTTVIAVVDGDTLQVRDDSDERTVNLCGITAPTDEAKTQLQQWIGKAGNRLVLAPTSDPNTIEAFILGEPEIFLQQELLINGLAKLTPDADCPNLAAMQKAQALAQRQHLGIWAH